MRPQREAAIISAQILKNLNGIAGLDHETALLCRNSIAQIVNAAAPERPLAKGRIGQAPIIRFYNNQRQNRPMVCCLLQGGMIGQSQVALEPENLERHRGSSVGIFSRNGKKPLVACGHAAVSQSRRTRWNVTP